MMTNTEAAQSRPAHKPVSPEALRRARSTSAPSDALAHAREELRELEAAITAADAADLAALRGAEDFGKDARFLTSEQHQQYARGAAAYGARLNIRTTKLEEARAALRAAEQSEARVLLEAGRLADAEIAREDAAREEAQRLAREDATRGEMVRLEATYESAKAALAGWEGAIEPIKESIVDSIISIEVANREVWKLLAEYQRRAQLADDAARKLALDPRHGAGLNWTALRRDVHQRLDRALLELEQGRTAGELPVLYAGARLMGGVESEILEFSTPEWARRERTS